MLLATDPGLEDLVAEELRERAPRTSVLDLPGVPAGSLIVETSAIESDLRALTMVHHLTDVLGEGPVSGIDALRELVAGIDIPELERAASFRVSSTCEDTPALDRMDVQRAAGGVLHRRYGTPVDLTEFEVHVRVDCLAGHARVGLQATREPLSNRIRRGAVLRSSLRPTVAAAMLRLAGAHREDGLLIDPMCGAGVIPVEAARLNPALRVEASDWDEPTVAVAAGTFSNHGLDVVPGVLDARSLGANRPEAFDYIVTDPPYGVRQGKRTKLGPLYRDLLDSFARALKPSGRLAVVVVRHRALDRAVSALPLRIVHRRTVNAGNLALTISVLERAPSNK